MGKSTVLKNKIAELQASAIECGGELSLSEKDLHDKDHLHCFWYESGQIASFWYEGFTCSIEVQGDVSVSVLDRDCEDVLLDYYRRNSSPFDDKSVRNVIKSDKTLEKLDDSGRLQWSLNNWVELRVFDEQDNEYPVDITLEENLLEAIDNFDLFIETVEEIMQEQDIEKASLSDLVENASARAEANSISKDSKTLTMDR
ncbi:MAG: hypothetical protein IKL72_05110 [Firmicutes bacterium]|nr:hypothetical protein [Bacillota bacterium]